MNMALNTKVCMCVCTYTLCTHTHTRKTKLVMEYKNVIAEKTINRISERFMRETVQKRRNKNRGWGRIEKKNYESQTMMQRMWPLTNRIPEKKNREK